MSGAPEAEAGEPARVVLLAFDFGAFCIPLANALADHARVTLVLPEPEVADRHGALDDRVALHTYDKPRLRQPLRQLGLCIRLIGLVRRVRPDVVHLQQGHFWFNLALPFLGRVPLVVTVHDAEPHLGDRGASKTPPRLMQLAFRRADRLIVHSERARALVMRTTGISPDRIDVIPLVVPLVETSAGDDHDHTDDPGTVLFFGRIWPYKGLDVLIGAEPLVSARVPGHRFVVAGEGEPFDRYRALMANPERFTVINRYVPADEQAALFRESAVVVLPYLEASQSGVVPIACAFGKPVVVTDVGGLPEVVEDGVTGFVVAPGDETALADAIVRVLSDDDLRRRLGDNARRSLDACSPARVARSTAATYDLLLGRQRSWAR
ncbi:MAG: glycosyl transferase group 1 [Acidimicrobiales bacterium]|nr:glycosyl transferase group 1 [Acidimicrobiales bacterium]